MHRPGTMVQKTIAFVFYGNYFYGLCAIALLLETVVQFALPIRDPLVYGLTFLATVLFYNYPYARNPADHAADPRAVWHRDHARFIRLNGILFSVALIGGGLIFIVRHAAQIRQIPVEGWILISLFPIIALLYYGSNYAARHYSLRQIGWAKPFLIGFVWTGVVYVYPLLYARWIVGQPLEMHVYHLLQFLKSMMYISMLAILFDVKDYAADKGKRLNTWIVRMGLKRTLFGLITPLILLGLLMFFGYAYIHQFSPGRVLLTMIPFLLLLAAIFALRKKRSLLFYLTVIDGLMIAKAIFGILAVKL